MRVTLEQAKAFQAKRGHGALLPTTIRYLEMADGNEELATQIAEYYQGTGREKDYTVGKVIRDYWTKDAPARAELEGGNG